MISALPLFSLGDPPMGILAYGCFDPVSTIYRIEKFLTESLSSIKLSVSVD